MGDRLHLQFLGTGGAFSDFRENYNNNGLLHLQGGGLMIDCGVTGCQSVKELGLHPGSLQGVLLTHLHGDHASPEQLIWERYYTSPEGPPAWKKTPLYGPPEVLLPLQRSLQPFIGTFVDQSLQGQEDGSEALLELHLGTEFEFDGLRVRFYPVHHIHDGAVDKPAFGLEFTLGERVFFWSGDTLFNPAFLEEQSARPEVQRIFHECTFMEPFPGTAHTHFAELSSLSERARRKLVIMHHHAVPPGTDLREMGAAQRHKSYYL